jgi:hypothetical protein
MKNYILLACCFLLMTCSRRNDDNNCRFLLNLGVNAEVNLSLPQYNQLNFPNNPVFIPFNQAGGNAGIIVNKVNSTSYRAFDAADPNHVPSGCSTLNINGIIGTCGCEDANEYSLLDGQPLGSNGLRCGLKEYRVDVSGNSLIITN